MIHSKAKAFKNEDIIREKKVRVGLIWVSALSQIQFSKLISSCLKVEWGYIKYSTYFRVGRFRVYPVPKGQIRAYTYSTLE